MFAAGAIPSPQTGLTDRLSQAETFIFYNFAPLMNNQKSSKTSYDVFLADGKHFLVDVIITMSQGQATV